ncbi:hypothetical protein GGI43DRAFT_406385 [Trichoderma evansii]
MPKLGDPSKRPIPLRPGNQSRQSIPSIHQSIKIRIFDFSAVPPCENRPETYVNVIPSGCLPSPLVAGGSTTLVGSGECGGKKERGRIHHREVGGWR